jgi:hypothetical protein
MTRLYFERIEVSVEEDQPKDFTWRRKIHPVTTILKRWVVRVDWWRQEVIRRYYKVECENLGIYEIYQERDGWYLERLYD